MTRARLFGTNMRVCTGYMYQMYGLRFIYKALLKQTFLTHSALQ